MLQTPTAGGSRASSGAIGLGRALLGGGLLGRRLLLVLGLSLACRLLVLLGLFFAETHKTTNLVNTEKTMKNNLGGFFRDY